MDDSQSLNNQRCIIDGVRENLLHSKIFSHKNDAEMSSL